MEVIISTVIASLTLLFSIIKFINEKRFERKNKEFEQFIIVLDRVAGRYENGTLMVDSQQLSAVYQLLEFKRFKHISLPVLEHYLEMCEKNKSIENTFQKGIKTVYKILKENS